MEVKCEVNLDGIDKALKELGPKLARKTLRKACSVVGDLWVTEMKSRVPVLKGDLRESIDKKVSTRKNGDAGTASVSVGPTFDTKDRKDGDGSQQPGVYGMFVEFGTAKSKAEPFVRPTFDATADKAVELFADTLRADLDLIVRE